MTSREFYRCGILSDLMRQYHYCVTMVEIREDNYYYKYGWNSDGALI